MWGVLEAPWHLTHPIWTSNQSRWICPLVPLLLGLDSGDRRERGPVVLTWLTTPRWAFGVQEQYGTTTEWLLHTEPCSIVLQRL